MTTVKMVIIFAHFCPYLLNELSEKAALALKLKLLKRGIGGYTQMMMEVCQKEAETRQNVLHNTLMVVPFFAIFSKIGGMALFISPERIELESCVCAQIKALEEGNRWLYPDGD